jgi:diaminohydroxyphosphoribosylaminopyrimidine deaminase/5-amino-6-(5-phosphoribosylamino)uracil reductase
MVGSVIVYENRIIGKAGIKKTHAEVNAINSVKDKSLLKKATIYVSLEPCSHFGKTPLF